MRRALLAVYISVFPLMVCSGIIYSVFTLFIFELGATTAGIGLIFSAGAASAAFGAPIFGKLSDRMGRKPVLLISMIIFVLTFLLYYMVRNYLDLIFVQCMEGVAWAALGATAVALISDMAPKEERGIAIGMYNTTWNLGWIVGPIIGGFLVEIVGFRKMFLVCSALILIGLLSTAIFVNSKDSVEQSAFRDDASIYEHCADIEKMLNDEMKYN